VQTDASAAVVGYAPEEIHTGEPTRSARLKWVVVVDETLPAGRAVNAAVCVAAATGQAVPGLLGPDAKDAAGDCHPGLPWAGCTILAASSSQLAAIRRKAVTTAGVFVADMPSVAQSTRVYDEYLEQVSTTDTDQLSYYAVSVIGPRNTIDKMVRKLALLP
jgi:hypothetical protein